MSVRLEVDASEAGTRLDVILVQRIDGLSRARARRLIQDGQVRVNGSRARKGARLGPGDQVELDSVPSPVDFVPEPNLQLPLVVVYEDTELVIVDKPAGMPSHPLRAHERGTLANALLARYPEMAGVGYGNREPGLLHRLDNDTSGLVIAARSDMVFQVLRDRLKAGEIDKAYLALVDGELAPQVVRLPIAPHPSDPRRVQVCEPEHPSAREAETRVVSARRVGSATLVEVRAPVAVRHQIRAHLAAIGHPLVGDALYGGPHQTGLDRHFLHASEVVLAHPTRPTVVRAHAPLPPELEAVLRRMSE